MSFSPLINVKDVTTCYTCSVLKWKVQTSQHVSAVWRILWQQLMLYNNIRQCQLLIWLSSILLYWIVRISNILRQLVMYKRHGQILSRAIQKPQTFLSAGIFYMCHLQQTNQHKKSFSWKGQMEITQRKNTHIRFSEKSPGKKKKKYIMFYFYIAGKFSSLNNGSKSYHSTNKSLPSASASASDT